MAIGFYLFLVADSDLYRTPRAVTGSSPGHRLTETVYL